MRANLLVIIVIALYLIPVPLYRRLAWWGLLFVWGVLILANPFGELADTLMWWAFCLIGSTVYLIARRLGPP